MNDAQTARVNEVFGLGKEDDGVAGEVKLDNDGWISFGSRSLTQGEAIDIAEKLVTAVQASVQREQVNAPHFFASVEIERRSGSRLGQAIRAIHRVYHA